MNKKKMRFLLILFVAIAACNQQKSATGDVGPDNSAVIADTALSGKWTIYPLNDTSHGKNPFISFGPAENTFTGNTGCNHMSGTFSRKENEIHFNEQIIVTKMACVGYDEQPFLQKLTSVDNFRLEKNTLYLRQKDVVMLTFRR